MNQDLLATVGGLLTFFFWGTSDWLAAKSSRKYDSYDVNLALRPPGLLIGGVLLLASYHGGLSALTPVFLAGIIATAAYIFMIKALSTGAIGIVMPIVSINPLITVGLALLFSGRVLSARQIVAMLVIMTGVLMLAYRKNDDQKSVRELHKETFLALASALFWGLTFFVLDRGVSHLPWQAVYGTFSLVMFIMGLLLVIIKARRQLGAAASSFVKNREGLASGMFVTLGSIAFFYAAGRVGNLLILVVIAAAAPLMASYLGAVFDREQLGLIKRLAAVIIVAGIVLLNL